jgi:hypothetical protein
MYADKPTMQGARIMPLKFWKLFFKLRNKSRRSLAGSVTIAGLLASACTPTVQLAMPNEPITINLNVRIEHEVRIRVERELDDIFSADSGLF